MAYRAEDSLPEALSILREGLALDPDNERFTQEIEELIESVERRIRIANDFDSLIDRLTAANTDDRMLAADVLETFAELRKEGDRVKADALCRVALTRRPDELDLLEAHQSVLRDLKRFAEAEELGGRIIEKVEKSGDAHRLFHALESQYLVFSADFSSDSSPENYARIRASQPEALADRMLALAEETNLDEHRYTALMAKGYFQAVLSNEDFTLNPEGIEFIRQADALAEKNGWTERAKTAESWIASWLACVYRVRESEEYSRKAGLPVDTLTLRARGNWRALYKRLRSRVDEYEIEALSMPTDHLKMYALGEDGRQACDLFITACWRLGKWVEAVETVERLNNATLGGILGACTYDARRQVLGERIELRDQLQHRVNRLTSQLAMTPQSPDSEEVKSVQRDLAIQATNLAQLNSDLRADELEIRNVSGQKPMSVQDMQALLDEDTAVIMYGLTWSSWARHGLVGVVTRQECHYDCSWALSALQQRDSDLRKRLKPFLELTRSPVAAEGSITELREWGRALYDKLIEPVGPYIAGKKHLIIVPSGLLAKVPFHLLCDRNGRFLFEEYEISYAQSVGVLKSCLARGRKLGGNVVIIADPTVTDTGARLTFAGNEALAIKKVYPDALLLMGDQATETAVKDVLSKADVIHFACHSLVNEESPMKSALVLAPDECNDGLLTAREICDYPVNAGLVVIGACESGSGGVSGGWRELAGMTRAWLLAGAPSMVTSLWKVDDKGTSELMAEFYRNLPSMSRVEALRRAQMTMMDRYENPYYWGAFVLYGDYR
jgi:CHAT domain-containing protein